MDAYLENDDAACVNMLHAANLGGKAINITQTTAGHAMCYKLTSLYGISHGHAAALCVSRLWPYMTAHTEKCIDPRGEEYLKGIFDNIAEAMGCGSVPEAIECLQGILAKLELKGPQVKDERLATVKTSPFTASPPKIPPPGSSIPSFQGRWGCMKKLYCRAACLRACGNCVNFYRVRSAVKSGNKRNRDRKK